MQNIWQTLTKPIFILAPMEDVTDAAFRQIVIACGKPSLTFTEFMSSDGFNSKGKDKVSSRVFFTPSEKPIIAQIWGNNPENYFKTAQELQKMGFDGIDINMGCPVRAITSKGCCSALINNQSLAKELIEAAKEGAPDLPISVKTRIGFNKIATEEWISFLLEQNLAAITVHGRIAKEMSKYPAKWDEIAKAVELRNSLNKQTLIIGNGDVTSYEDGMNKIKTYGVDGVMVGRGIFHNPWFFNPQIKLENITIKERIELLIKHIELYDKTWHDKKPFELMKKFFKVYIQGFDHAQDLRNHLMSFNNAKDALQFLKSLNHLGLPHNT